MTRNRLAALLSVVLIAGSAWGATVVVGQQGAQQPVFRAGATFVNVDAYPRRNGKIVEGLRAQDFQIFEDGKPQAVERFEFVRIPPNTPDADRRDPASIGEAERLAADPHNRIFVVYLDFYHSTIVGSHESRRPVLDFLGRAIGPTDLFGVMTPEMAATQITFGRRLETLEEQLAKYWTWGEANRLAVISNTPAERRLEECFITRWPDPRRSDALVKRLLLTTREQRVIASLEDLVRRLGALRDERKNVLMFTGPWVPQDSNQDLLENLWNEKPTVGVGTGGRIGLGAANQKQGLPEHSDCDALLNQLAHTDLKQQFRDLLAAANRANVSFFPVDAEGLRVSGVTADGRSSSVSLAATGTLRELAENTDGTAVVGTNDVGGALKQIADDLAAYYLLGYYSTNTANDGRFRRIEVKVTQPDVRVAARRGYLAPSTATLRAAEDAAAVTAASAVTPEVTAELGRLGRLRPEATMFGYGAAHEGRVAVVAEIAGAEMASGRWKNGGGVTVKLTATDGGTLEGAGKIDAGARSTVIEVPLAAEARGPWQVVVTVASEGARLEDSFAVAAAAAGLAGAPIVLRGTPSPRSPLQPVADFLFARTQRIRVAWPVTLPLTERTARLLSRQGKPLQVPVTLSDRADGDRAWLDADLVLTPLSEGDYLIEMTVAREQARATRLVAFRVSR